MATFTVGSPTDFPEGELRVVRTGLDQTVVCRVAGRLYAFEDRCSHDDGPLGGGWLEGCEVECPRHGARFDVRDGRALRMPAVAPIETYPVEESDGQVRVTRQD